MLHQTGVKASPCNRLWRRCELFKKRWSRREPTKNASRLTLSRREQRAKNCVVRMRNCAVICKIAQREEEDQELATPPREFPMPFSQEIMDAIIPATLVGPKVTFTGTGDPEAHLTTFHTQMMMVGGSDAVRCKLFMSTLAGTTMYWFISLLDGHVTSFPQLTKLFRAQYIVNRAPPSISYDLFDIRQYQGESLKEFLHRFGAQVVWLNLKDERMMVHTFRKGIVSGPFSESLIRNHPKTFVEIRRRAVAHIVAEEKVNKKCTCMVPTRPRATGRP